MALGDSAEWLIEAGWIAAFTANTDLAAAVASPAGGIMRAQDLSHTMAYPCVTVHCFGAQDDPEADVRGGDYQAAVALYARTDKRIDATGQTVNQLKRGMRDTINGSGLITTLESVGSLRVLGVTIDPEQLAADDDEERVRGLVAHCHISVSNLPEE